MASGENEFDTPALKDVSVAHVIYCHCNSLTGKTKSTNTQTTTKRKADTAHMRLAWICSSLHIGQLGNVYVSGRNFLCITCPFLSVPQSTCSMRMLLMNHMIKEELHYLKSVSVNCQI